MSENVMDGALPDDDDAGPWRCGLCAEDADRCECGDPLALIVRVPSAVTAEDDHEMLGRELVRMLNEIRAENYGVGLPIRLLATGWGKPGEVVTPEAPADLVALVREWQEAREADPHGGTDRWMQAVEALVSWDGPGPEPAEECTGVAATYCPVHGSCTCPRREDGEVMYDEGHRPCPLHDPLSPHPAVELVRAPSWCGDTAIPPPPEVVTEWEAMTKPALLHELAIYRELNEGLSNLAVGWRDAMRRLRREVVEQLDDDLSALHDQVAAEALRWVRDLIDATGVKDDDPTPVQVSTTVEHGARRPTDGVVLSGHTNGPWQTVMEETYDEAGYERVQRTVTVTTATGPWVSVGGGETGAG